MIFLHFFSAAIFFPLQYNMAGPRFSVRALCLPFCKIANGLCTCTFFAYFLWVRALLFITSWGSRMFYKEESGEGNCRGARQLFCGGALLLLALNLVLLLVLALSKNLSRSEERPRQLFLTLSLLCLTKN